MEVLKLPDDILYCLFSYFSPDFMKANYFNLKDYKNILDYVIKKYNFDHLFWETKIKIPGNYIIERNEHGVNKKQIVYIDDKSKYGKNIIIYEFNYGYIGFHEGSTTYKNIRFLTDEERKIKESGDFWRLPQEFYQSV